MTSSSFPSRNPLNYQGTNVTNPPQQYSFDRAPTTYDWETFNIGDEWLDKSSSPRVWYKLLSKARQPSPADINARAVWKPITSNGANDLSSLTGNTGGEILPDSTGTINILGTPGQINVAGSGNTLTLSLTGGGTAIDSLTVDTGGPVTPNGSGVVNLIGGNNIRVTAAAAPTTQALINVFGTTQYNVQVGNATGSLSSIAPSATSGVPLISQGAAANPVFGTVTVPGGGTGAVSLTGVLIGNGTSPVTAQTPLGVSNGGTGVATLTGLALGNGTSAFTAVSYTPKTSYTPVLAFGGGSTGITYNVQDGFYYVIGGVCYFLINLNLTSKGSSTGIATITLPFASTAPQSINISATLLSTNNAAASYFFSDIAFGNSSLTLFYCTASTGVYTELRDTDFTGNDSIDIQGFYFI